MPSQRTLDRFEEEREARALDYKVIPLGFVSHPVNGGVARFLVVRGGVSKHASVEVDPFPMPLDQMDGWAEHTAQRLRVLLP
jgi:hypothetical protein